MPVLLAVAALAAVLALAAARRRRRRDRVADPKDTAVAALASLVGRSREVAAPPLRDVPAPGRPCVTILGDARPRPRPAPHAVRRAS